MCFTYADTDTIHFSFELSSNTRSPCTSTTTTLHIRVCTGCMLSMYASICIYLKLYYTIHVYIHGNSMFMVENTYTCICTQAICMYWCIYYILYSTYLLSHVLFLAHGVAGVEVVLNTQVHSIHKYNMYIYTFTKLYTNTYKLLSVKCEAI